MRNIIYKIIQKHYGESGQVMTTSGEIADLMKRFILWKDENSIHWLHSNNKYAYRKDIKQGEPDWWTIDELFEYWHNEIYIKNERL